MIPRNSWLPMTKRHIYLWFGCRGICDDFVEVTEAGGHRQIFFVLDYHGEKGARAPFRVFASELSVGAPERTKIVSNIDL
jgi:hypothetical protein